MLPAGQHVTGLLADDLGARELRDRLRRAVPETDDSVQIDEEHAVADRLEHARRVRPLFDLPVQLSVLDGDAGAAGELFGEGEVVRAVAAPGLRCHEGHARTWSRTTSGTPM